MLIASILIIIGFLLLIKGADWMVDGSSSLAKKYKVSDLVIGLTIVAFGTSAPELVVNTVAAFDGHADIVLGNVIGSNNFNLFVILGIVGLISPIVVKSSTVWKEIPLSLLAVLVFLVLANDWLFGGTSFLTRWDALILILLFGGFMLYIYLQMRNVQNKTEDSVVNTSNLAIWGMIIGGLAGLVLGGKLVVDNAITVASALGVSQKVIGLTVVAAGTSLPELVTSVMAARKKNGDIAIGNVIGSNIFNITLILSVSSFIRPIPYNTAFNTDLLLLLGGTLFLFIAMFTGKQKKLDRWEAFLFLITFIGYTTYMILN